MSNTIAVHMDARYLPDGVWLGKAISAMKPDFVFAEGFDPVHDEGWCPCRIGDTECGFEWELTRASKSSDGLAARGFGSVATLQWRSSDSDGLCAMLVAANLAHIVGGVVEDVDGQLIETNQVLRWASDAIAGIARNARRRKPRDPVKLAAGWLASLPGARVAELERPLAGEPAIFVRFDSGLLVKGCRWTYAADGQPGVSTHQRTPENLDRAVDLMRGVIKREPVVEARIAPATLDLHIRWPSASLVLYPVAARHATVREQLLGSGERWSLTGKGNASVSPDLQDACLVLS